MKTFEVILTTAVLGTVVFDVAAQNNPPACQTTEAWHPTYSAGWTNGYCRLTKDCNSPSYDTELACCKGAYAGQVSGACLKSLPNPPTTSPTEEGGLDVWYPDYDTAWSEASCKNDRPLPSGRPTYDSQLACCKGAYGGQVSGACLKSLPSPPTTSPTEENGGGIWYPDYDTNWSEATCKNERPFPFTTGGRPTYDSQLACCKAAYGGQTSGACLQSLPSPPTTSPTEEGGADFWYPDYDTSWAEATCKNERPLPFTPGGRPTYDTQLECCKAAYGGQTSGACLQALPSPPTTSPTEEGGADFWYPDYDTSWAEATCKNDRPLPFGPGGRPTYDSQLECCKAAYAGQTSGACLQSLPSPPTTSPTEEGGLDVYYADYDSNWANAVCINERPLPSGRPTYTTLESCCNGAYGGQTSHACQCAVDSCYSCKCSGVENGCYATSAGDTGSGTVDNSNNKATCEGPSGSPTGNVWTSQCGFEC